MSISLELITSPEEADSLLKTAQRDKRVIEHRKDSIDFRTESTNESAAELQLNLTNTQAAIVASTAIISSLPDGLKKEEEITKKMGLEVKLRKLNESVLKIGSVAVIEREYDADLLERQLAGIEDFMNAVISRKSEL
jgi:hypothetical protein